MDRKTRERLAEKCMLGKQRVESCAPGEKCRKCGWNADEAARRKAIPVRACEDGLRRKDIK